mmetsp:Transcript_14432/g.42472  ORF Transcript_14432/g.42472 Transcript_14432/m.42472 type:complete len:641 (+) Transcript_14432:609-2531(+)
MRRHLLRGAPGRVRRRRRAAGAPLALVRRADPRALARPLARLVRQPRLLQLQLGDERRRAARRRARRRLGGRPGEGRGAAAARRGRRRRHGGAARRRRHRGRAAARLCVRGAPHRAARGVRAGPVSRDARQHVHALGDHRPAGARPEDGGAAAQGGLPHLLLRTAVLRADGQDRGRVWRAPVQLPGKVLEARRAALAGPDPARRALARDRPRGGAQGGAAQLAGGAPRRVEDPPRAAEGTLQCAQPVELRPHAQGPDSRGVVPRLHDRGDAGGSAAGDQPVGRARAVHPQRARDGRGAAHLLPGQQGHLGLPGDHRHVRRAPVRRDQPGRLHCHHLPLPLRRHVWRRRPRLDGHRLCPLSVRQRDEDARPLCAVARRHHHHGGPRPVHAAADGHLLHLLRRALQRRLWPHGGLLRHELDRDAATPRRAARAQGAWDGLPFRHRPWLAPFGQRALVRQLVQDEALDRARRGADAARPRHITRQRSRRPERARRLVRLCAAGHLHALHLWLPRLLHLLQVVDRLGGGGARRPLPDHAAHLLLHVAGGSARRGAALRGAGEGAGPAAAAGLCGGALDAPRQAAAPAAETPRARGLQERGVPTHRARRPGGGARAAAEHERPRHRRGLRLGGLVQQRQGVRRGV